MRAALKFGTRRSISSITGNGAGGDSMSFRLYELMTWQFNPLHISV